VERKSGRSALASSVSKEKTSGTLAKIKAIAANLEQVRVYRQRLRDLSWLMKMISEPIARRANVEDKTSGGFWLKRPRQGIRGPGCLVSA